MSQRVAREHESEQAVGGLRNAARAVDRVPGWKLVGCKLSELIEALVSDIEGNLDKVLNGLGRVDQVHVSQEACESLRRKIITSFHVKETDLLPGLGGGGWFPEFSKFLPPRKVTLMFIFISG